MIMKHDKIPAQPRTKFPARSEPSYNFKTHVNILRKYNE
jgi:hypothetical protein